MISADKVRAGERVSGDEALSLYQHASTALLGQLADSVRLVSRGGQAQSAKITRFAIPGARLLAVLFEFAGGIQVHVAGSALRRALAEVDEGYAPIRETDQHEAAPAEVSRHRMRHSQREPNGDGCVHSVAAPLHDCDPHIGGERLLSGYHAMRRVHGFASNGLGRQQED